VSLEVLGGPTFSESQAIVRVCTLLSASPRSELTVTLQSVNSNAQGKPFDMVHKSIIYMYGVIVTPKNYIADLTETTFFNVQWMQRY